MVSTQKQDVRLKSLDTLSNVNSCSILSKSDHGFYIDARNAKVCDYRFTVGGTGLSESSESESEASTAISRVLIGNETVALSPIMGTTGIAVPTTIDIVYELAKAGYELDTSTFVLSASIVLPDLENTGSTAVANVSENTITYTPGSAQNGLERLLYSYSDGSSVLAGTIEVATSSDMNTAPLANSFVHDTMVSLNTEQVIDVGAYVSDDDGDSLQLIDVFGFDSTNTIIEDVDKDGNQDFNSTLFTFQSSVSGNHEVTYTVTDLKGGYASGVIKILVEPDFRVVQDWEDITIPDSTIGADITFTGPLSQGYADYILAAYTDTYLGDGLTAPAGFNFVASSYDDADQICLNRGGRLPIERELNDLFTAKGNVFKSDNWPVTQSFWLADKTANNQAKVFSLANGSSDVSQTDDVSVAKLVTCVLLDSENVKSFSFQNKVVHEPATASSPYVLSALVVDPDGNAAPYQKVDTSVEDTSKGNVESASLYTDGSGEFAQNYYDYSMRPNILNISTLGDSEVELLDILRDEFLLSVDDPTSWNRLALTHRSAASGPLRPHTKAGLPLLYNQTQNTNVYNRNSFKGEDFIAELELTTPSVARSGKYEFYIQQVSVMPDSTWGVDHMEPGAPNSTKAFSVVINVYNNKVDIFSGYGSLLASYTLNLKGDRKVWFESRDGIFSLYTISGVEGEKPQEPLISTTMDWGQIDPDQPYWVGLGATNADTSDGSNLLASEVLFRSFARE